MLKIDVIKFESHDVITSSIPEVKNCVCKAGCFEWTRPDGYTPVVGPFKSHYHGNSGDCYCDANDHYYPNYR